MGGTAGNHFGLLDQNLRVCCLWTVVNFFGVGVFIRVVLVTFFARNGVVYGPRATTMGYVDVFVYFNGFGVFGAVTNVIPGRAFDLFGVIMGFN